MKKRSGPTDINIYLSAKHIKVTNLLGTPRISGRVQARKESGANGRGGGVAKTERRNQILGKNG